ncbi:hypothetical protein [Streptomyces xantholiticus]|uniref:Uncharacterized protein n=1 Tax=Streptomyces xantholiticus TaxID=68285 RepID=A0ABV1UW32_9ACTN
MQELYERLELRTAVLRVAESGGQLGVHLLLFAASSERTRLGHRLLQHFRTRVELHIKTVSDGRFGGTKPDGAVLIDPSVRGPIRFDTRRRPASGQSSSAR